MLLTIIKLALKSGLRGRTRFTMLMARTFPQLRNVPLEMPHGNDLYLDLRLVMTHDLLVGKLIEEDEQKVMKRFVKVGMTVYDVGAYVGLHTTFLSSLVGETGSVIAFEPQPHLLDSLQNTVSRLDNAKLFCFALSDKNEKISFFIAKEQSMSSLSDWTGEGTRIEVETFRLDDIVEKESLPPPDLIKCDVEGAEILCFRGGRETLETAQPMLLFESLAEATKNLGFSQNDVFEFLKNLKNPNYRFFEIQNKGGLIEISKPLSAYTNILALPQSRFSPSEIQDFLTKN